MTFYDEKILPYIIDCVCSQAQLTEIRKKIVPLAHGDVLEIGMGSGTNLPLYDVNKVNKVYGLEPSEGMRRRAQDNISKATVDMQWIDLPGEEIPLADASVDCIVLTFTLCSIANWQEAMAQMYRVLKPGGKLYFCEHGQAPEENVQKVQDVLTPFWKTIGGGCHLNRPTKAFITQSGFSIEQIDHTYMKKTPRFVGYISYGIASKPLS